MNSENLYASLTGRLTDANRPSILSHLQKSTGFSSLSLFRAAATPQEQARVLPELLTLAHGCEIQPRPERQAGGVAVSVAVEQRMGAIPVECATVKPGGIDRAIEILESLKLGTVAQVSIYVTVLNPEPI